jgi:hypothetical protein
MRTKTLVALPVAAGLALGGASLATADDPAQVKREHLRPALVKGGRMLPPPLFLHEDMGPFGLDREIAEDMAKELGLPAERVTAAMRKALGARFDRQRDAALKCFDDKKNCKPHLP